jgi:hypothetical protein
MRGLLAVVLLSGCSASIEQVERSAPEIPSMEAASWIGTPTSLRSLRGNVVLVEAWHRH